MRAAIVVVALLAGAPVTAHADAIVLAEGTILAGNPFGAIFGGISESANFCGEDRDLDGIDGITFDVPPVARGMTATLTTSSTGVDADVYWYDEACRPIDGALDERGTGNETGTVPATAASGVIDLILGAQAEVRLTAG